MNNKVKIIFLTFVLGFGFNSCREIHTKQKEVFPLTIVINPDEAGIDSIKLSEIADKVEYLPLQINESVLLGYIYDFKVTSSFIFVENGLELFRFGTDGRFINKVYNAGRGPGEALSVCSAIDEEHNRVFVFDRNKTVKIYSFSGNYLSAFEEPIIPVESLPPCKIEYFENHLFVSVPQRPGVKYLYSLYNLNTDSIIPLYKNKYQYTKDQQSKWPSIIRYDYCYQLSDTAFIFKEKFCDTVFILNRKLEVRPRFILDIGVRKLEWETWRDNGMFNIGTGPPEGFWGHSVAESNNYLFFTLSSFKRPKIFAIYDKNSGSLKMSTIPHFDSEGSQVYLKNDLDFLVDFPAFNKSQGYIFYSGNCLYSVLDAKYFMESYSKAAEGRKNSSEYLRNMKPILSSVTAFSNPVIMKIHLK